jgi:hypothetical protein
MEARPWLKIGASAAAVVLVALLARREDPDRWGPWVVGGLVLLIVVMVAYGLRQLRR